jgi:hypothetical protein
LSHKDGVMALTHHFLPTTHHNIRIMVHDCLSAYTNSPVKTIACIPLSRFWHTIQIKIFLQSDIWGSLTSWWQLFLLAKNVSTQEMEYVCLKSCHMYL